MHLPPCPFLYIISLERTSLVASILVFLLSVCIYTRIRTGIAYSGVLAQRESATKDVAVIPYWIPYLGSALSFATNVEQSCNSARDEHSDGVVAFQIGRTKYHLLTMPSLVQQVFSRRTSILSKQAVLTWFMKVAFDDRGTSVKEPDAFHAVHKVLNLMLRDKFVKETTTSTALLVEKRAAFLVSLGERADIPKQSVWERLGRVQMVDEHCADADLYPLIVNFVGDIIVRVLYGNAFVDNNPNLLQDLWIFDDGVHLLLNGVLALTPKARRAKAARARLLQAIEEWQVALTRVQKGLDPGRKWGRMDDVSEAMTLRVKGWEESGASARLRSSNDASVLWGANANSNKNIYWMLLQIYTRPDLLSELRKEIAPFVKRASNRSSSSALIDAGNNIELEMDVEGLTSSCPLMKATFYETMRVNMSGIGVRHVEQDFTLTESTGDAHLFSKQRAQSYTIPAGSMLALSNGSMQQDPRLFPRPQAFDPQRFLFPDDKVPGQRVARMSNLNTFGGGVYKCKGRYFAEKEVLVFVAALISTWQVEGSSRDGKLQVPEMGVAGAARAPRVDIRVRLRRRGQNHLLHTCFTRLENQG